MAKITIGTSPPFARIRAESFWARFTNPKLADYHRKAFASGMATAVGDAKRGATRGALAVQPRAFA